MYRRKPEATEVSVLIKRQSSSSAQTIVYSYVECLQASANSHSCKKAAAYRTLIEWTGAGKNIQNQHNLRFDRLKKIKHNQNYLSISDGRRSGDRCM